MLIGLLGFNWLLGSILYPLGSWLPDTYLAISTYIICLFLIKHRDSTKPKLVAISFLNEYSNEKNDKDI